jgi:integrase/recombinase XerD
MAISPRTEEAYYAAVHHVGQHFAKAPDLVSAEEFRQYCLYLKAEKQVARQTSTKVMCAFKLFWEKTLHRLWPAELQLVRANPRFKLPVVLSAAEVRRLLAAVPARDHRVALTTIYSCGLRLGEALRLEVRDVDAERRFLHIRAGKGGRDRYVPLPERTLLLLREQWKTHRHPALLFPAKGHNGQGAPTATESMCRTTLQRAFRLALQASGVKKRRFTIPATTGIVRSAASPTPPTGSNASGRACFCPRRISSPPSPCPMNCAG